MSEDFEVLRGRRGVGLGEGEGGGQGEMKEYLHEGGVLSGGRSGSPLMTIEQSWVGHPAYASR